MNKNTNWLIDSTHSEIAFKVRHMMISTVTGYFEDFQATAQTDGDNFEDAHIEFRAKTASISTKNKDRDAHLQSDDFFNAAEFPELKFTSKSFKGNQLIGDLTIRDITKEITLEAELHGVAVDPYGQTKAGFEISGDINRKDYNLTWDAVTETGSIVVSDKVRLVINVQFIKQA
ncbi:MAG TPA: YceI family protein [Saprospiraceae bacterium]|nr:YceI family protein [Saprospiraceae bacterium]HQW55637.1 YceI family protein [Saprospiraceae bacterium]